MKGKNIRKENIKKPARQPVSHDHKVYFTDQKSGIDYRIIQDNYEAEVRLRFTNELVGIYKAATRNWKKVQFGNYLTRDVRIMVESLYA